MHDDQDRKPGFRISRRGALAGAAGLALPAVLSARAHAAGKRVVIGTWGGDYARLLHENIEAPLVIPQGIKVIQDVGDEPPRMAKVIAQRMLPHGSMDIACAEAPYAWRMHNMGLLETLDEKKIPNLAHVDPNMRSDFLVPHIWSPQILIYNPKTVSAPPLTFGDLLAPRFKGKVGFPNGNNLYVMMAASLFASGNVDDLAKAKALLIKLNGNGLRLYPETDTVGTAFKSGELQAGVMWFARVVMWQNAGIPVQASFPKEGSVIYISGFVVPKNAPDKEAAYAYLNAALDPRAQEGFAKHMGYLPTVTNAKLTGKVAQQLALPNPKPKLIPPDYAFDAKITAGFNDWWQQTIQKA